MKIPEGYVRSISINSQQIWQSKYINYVHLGTTEPGGNVIYGTEGWQDGYRWSLSGKAITAASSARVSGWIPFISGATYRVRNFNGNKVGYMDGIYFALANEDGSCVTHTKKISDTSIYDVNTDTFTFVMTDSTYKYFRISGFKVADKEPIITIDEPMGNMITFSIDGVSYQIREGMTWGEWVNSRYNDTELTIVTHWQASDVIGVSPSYVLEPYIYVKPQALIQAKDYSLGQETAEPV